MYMDNYRILAGPRLMIGYKGDLRGASAHLHDTRGLVYWSGVERKTHSYA